MANKKIKHIIAKLLGETTEETLDIYDESALHATDIVDNLTSNDATKVLSAKQGKALNDSLTNLISTGTATTNTSVCTGTCKWTKIGRILFISIEDLAITTQISDNTTALFSNLPTASTKVFLAQQYNTGTSKRFAFASQKITAWYDTLPVSSFQYYALIAVI